MTFRGVGDDAIVDNLGAGTEDAQPWYQYIESVRTINIEGIKSISGNSFMNAYNLETVNIT
ncbi:MAG: hypothetical protein II951_00155 [Bacteroidales bacterium]|nr:hypothetical protein [Bacteroidales bacterium]